MTAKISQQKKTGKNFLKFNGEGKIFPVGHNVYPCMEANSRIQAVEANYMMMRRKRTMMIALEIVPIAIHCRRSETSTFSL